MYCTDMADFRLECEDLFKRLLRHNGHGYLGQFEMICRKLLPSNTFMIEVQDLPVTCLKISEAAAKRWRPDDRACILSDSLTASTLSLYCEWIAYRIYVQGGFGSLTLRFSYLEHENRCKIFSRWMLTYQDKGFISD